MVRVSAINDSMTTTEIYQMTEPRVDERLGHFFDKCGLKEIEYKPLLEKYGVEKETLIKDSRSFKVIEDILPILCNNAENRKEILYNYLKSNNYFDNNSAIVDIGWKGSMQNSLNQIFPDYPKMGFYFGKGKSDFDVQSFGFLDNSDDIIEAGMVLYETMFMTNHGTTIGYMWNADRNCIEPILKESEFSEDAARRIRKIQEGALYYIDRAAQYCYQKDIIQDENSFKNRFLKLAINPDIQVIKLLGDLPYFDSFVSKLVCDYKELPNPDNKIELQKWYDYIEHKNAKSFLLKIRKLIKNK